jgi:hypothetical protein
MFHVASRAAAAGVVLRSSYYHAVRLTLCKQTGQLAVDKGDCMLVVLSC